MTRKLLFKRRAALTVLPKAKRVPLPPLNDGADCPHASVDQQHAQRRVKQEVDEVSEGRRGRGRQRLVQHSGTWVLKTHIQYTGVTTDEKCHTQAELLTHTHKQICRNVGPHSQRAGVFLCKVRQVDIGKVYK